MMAFDKFFAVPSLLWFSSYFKTYLIDSTKMLSDYRTTDTMQYFLCLLGCTLSLLLFIGKPKMLMNSLSYFTLWLLYLSHFAGGDRFMTFQWDILLLEAGFISIFFAPLWHTSQYNHPSPSVSLTRELLRWLAFRLLVSSGLVKLLSRCRTWWTLTALHYHFESQPIPHVLSWYAQ
jgi:hypothetical protein